MSGRDTCMYWNIYQGLYYFLQFLVFIMSFCNRHLLILLFSHLHVRGRQIFFLKQKIFNSCRVLFQKVPSVFGLRNGAYKNMLCDLSYICGKYIASFVHSQSAFSTFLESRVRHTYMYFYWILIIFSQFSKRKALSGIGLVNSLLFFLFGDSFCNPQKDDQRRCLVQKYFKWVNMRQKNKNFLNVNLYTRTL